MNSCCWGLTTTFLTATIWNRRKSKCWRVLFTSSFQMLASIKIRFWVRFLLFLILRWPLVGHLWLRINSFKLKWRKQDQKPISNIGNAHKNTTNSTLLKRPQQLHILIGRLRIRLWSCESTMLVAAQAQKAVITTPVRSTNRQTQKF